jgi:hypothetical protein
MFEKTSTEQQTRRTAWRLVAYLLLLPVWLLALMSFGSLGAVFLLALVLGPRFFLLVPVVIGVLALIGAMVAFAKQHAIRDRLLTVLSAISLLPAVIVIALSAGFLLGDNPRSGLPSSGNPATVGLRIAYQCDERYPSSLRHICVMRADGTGQSLLTSGYDESQPVWSPDGKKVAFVGLLDGAQIPESIMVIDADGRNLKLLTPGYNMRWMADGTRISFIPRGGDRSYWAVDLDGNLKGEVYGATRGSFSEDHTRLAYEDGSYIAVRSIDGKNAKRLVQGAAPEWSSRDEQTIFFWRGSRTVINADGSSAAVPAPDQDSEYASQVSPLSPDGKRIVFYELHTGDQCTEPTNLAGPEIQCENIFLKDVDGDLELMLTHGSNPVWSPDGKQIAYDYHGRIFVIKADGNGMKELAIGENPVWSPQ